MRIQKNKKGTRSFCWCTMPQGVLPEALQPPRSAAIAASRAQGPIGPRGPMGPMGPHGAPMGPHGAPMGPLGPFRPGRKSGSHIFFFFPRILGPEAQKSPKKKVRPRPNHYHGCIRGGILSPGADSDLDLVS